MVLTNGLRRAVRGLLALANRLNGAVRPWLILPNELCGGLSRRLILCVLLRVKKLLEEVPGEPGEPVASTGSGTQTPWAEQQGPGKEAALALSARNLLRVPPEALD